MKLLTICCCNQNGADALALMRESLLHYHPQWHDKIVWRGIDNGSDDGAWEYMQEYFDYARRNERWIDGVFYNPQHGVCLDELSQQSDTPYTLIIDNDVEILGPCLDGFMDLLGDHDCLSIPPLGPMGNVTMRNWDGSPVELKSSPRIDPAFTLWHTERLKLRTAQVSWSRYINLDTREWFDAGAMLRCVTDVREFSSMYESVRHYGEISALWNVGPECVEPWWLEKKPILEARYATIRQRLAEIRALCN